MSCVETTMYMLHLKKNTRSRSHVHEIPNNVMRMLAGGTLYALLLSNRLTTPCGNILKSTAVSLVC